MTTGAKNSGPLPRVQVGISGWIIESGELAEPIAGSIIHGLGVRIRPTGYGQELELTRVTGKVRWTRFDPRIQLIESLLELDGYSLLTQDSGTAHTPLPAIGSRIECTGYLYGIAPYEYEDFELPDVRMDWHVLTARWVPHSGISDYEDIVVDLEPNE
jgi:hypothetical protein